MFWARQMSKWVTKEIIEDIKRPIKRNKEAKVSYDEIIEKQKESKRRFSEKMKDLNDKIKEANELKEKKLLEKDKLEVEREEWERSRKQLLMQEDMWGLISGMPDVIPFYSPWQQDEGIHPFPKRFVNIDTDVPEVKLEKRLQEIKSIKNARSQEMYAWLGDVFDEQGPKMVEKLGKIYVFGISDEDDIEVPITFDFKNDKGNLYIGYPGEKDQEAVACKITMSEKDFHRILDAELGTRKALL